MNTIYLLSSDGHRDSVNLQNFATNEQELIELLIIENLEIGQKVFTDSLEIDYAKGEIYYRFADDYDNSYEDSRYYYFFKLTKVKL